MAAERIFDGAYIEIASGVSGSTGEGFCEVTVRVGAEGRAVSIGQLTPNEVRGMALHWLEVAEAAESDAAVFAELQRTEVPVDVALAFIGELRKHRAAK